MIALDSKFIESISQNVQLQAVGLLQIREKQRKVGSLQRSCDDCSWS
eukprot:SAG11_NODE_3443_length_2445_cov_1.454390_2_plen_47_part_00